MSISIHTHTRSCAFSPSAGEATPSFSMFCFSGSHPTPSCSLSQPLHISNPFTISAFPPLGIVSSPYSFMAPVHTQFYVGPLLPDAVLCSCGYQFLTSPQNRLTFSPSLLPLIQLCRSYSASLQCCILWCRCFHNGSGSQPCHALTALVSITSGQHYRSQHPAQPPTPTLGAQRHAE